jgi:hypothetical protein
MALFDREDPHPHSNGREAKVETFMWIQLHRSCHRLSLWACRALIACAVLLILCLTILWTRGNYLDAESGDLRAAGYSIGFIRDGHAVAIVASNDVSTDLRGFYHFNLGRGVMGVLLKPTYGFSWMTVDSTFVTGFILPAPVWLGLAIASLVTLLWLERKIRRHLKKASHAHTLCPACRYDLRAHAFGDKCPECGTLIAASIARRVGNETSPG